MTMQRPNLAKVRRNYHANDERAIQNYQNAATIYAKRVLKFTWNNNKNDKLLRVRTKTNK